MRIGSPSEHRSEEMAEKGFGMLKINSGKQISSFFSPKQAEMLQFLYYTEYEIIRETFALQQAVNLQKKQGEQARTLKSIQIEGHFRAMSEKLHNRILREDIDLDRELSRLQMAWTTSHIPHFHRYYFEKQLLTALFRNLEPLIKGENTLILSEQHVYFSITRTIGTREALLRKLKRQIAELTPQDVYEYLHLGHQRFRLAQARQEQLRYNLQGFKLKKVVDPKEDVSDRCKFQFFGEGLLRLHELTLHILDLIGSWKSYLRSLTHYQRQQKERLQFYFFEDNYLLKILTDLDWLQTTFLDNFYDFAPRNDPFLLRPALILEDHPKYGYDQKLLKQILLPIPEQLPNILAKLQMLSEEYKANIRSRRIYDLDKRRKGNWSLKKNPTSEEQPLSNHILRRLSPQKSTAKYLNKYIENPEGSPMKKSASTKILRIRPSLRKIAPIVDIGKDKILITDNNPYSRSPERTNLDNQIRERNKSVINQSPNGQSRAEGESSAVIDMIESLKKQTIERVRVDLVQLKDQMRSKSKALEQYIDQKVNEAMKPLFLYRPEKVLQLPISFTTISLEEDDLLGYMSRMIKKSAGKYSQMQPPEEELIRRIKLEPYCYVFKATVGEQEISSIIVVPNSKLDYKCFRVLYVAVYDAAQFQLILRMFVEFLWQYENGYEVIYSFYIPVGNQAVQKFLKAVQLSLEQHSLVYHRQLYSNLSEQQFIFRRKGKNDRKVANPFIQSLDIEMRLLLSGKKLTVETRRLPEAHCSYDYLLVHLFRKFLPADGFLQLQEGCSWKTRFKRVLELGIVFEKDPAEAIIPTKLWEATNIIDLERKLLESKQKLLELSDLGQINEIKMFQLKINVSLPYPVKCAAFRPGQLFYRYSINSKLDFFTHPYTLQRFYLLPLKESNNLTLLLFSASHYLAGQQSQRIHREGRTSATQPLADEGVENSLLLYLEDVIHAPLEVSEFEALWVPMLRSQEGTESRQQVYLPTYRLSELQAIKKELFLAQKADWFCNLEMQPAIKFPFKRTLDVLIEKPCGVALLGKDSLLLFYARIFA